MTIFQSFTF